MPRLTRLLERLEELRKINGEREVEGVGAGLVPALLEGTHKGCPYNCPRKARSRIGLNSPQVVCSPNRRLPNGLFTLHKVRSRPPPVPFLLASDS